MRIRRIRLVLPSRMRGAADGDARQIAETVARALLREGATAGTLRIEVNGAGRSAGHMAADLAGVASRAARSATMWEG
ncbi:hypothetical protein LGR54_05485 [Ancylobacter sp. Lp-2]|uniref:hypothetical protein n=1 Tax=Ancylobacter sp. Lp-2 TaxID=2881339 RepID=UPI001E32DCB2|nr:hypothetical protein [Ancylobacter sp. Lp-2]MCB4768048.1 hypothetical protein [Ancylobacter sp. Lp-2]